MPVVNLGTGGEIPPEIARDSEVAAAINSHVAATDPHPQYLLQSEGDARYRQSAIALTDADIPAPIARDAETAAAIAAHENKTDPHPNLWQRIVAGFLSLTGGQRILKNNPAISNNSFFGGSNHLELTTNNGSNPILSFHKGGVSATSLYHAGYGDNTLRVRNADGLDAAIIHDGNIAAKTAGNSNNLINLLGALIGPAAHWNGNYRWRHLGDWNPGDNAILVHRASVADLAAYASLAGGVTLDDGTSIRTKLVSGTTAATQGGSAITPLGLDASTIISAEIIVKPAPNVVVCESFKNGAGSPSGNLFSWAIINTDIYVHNVANESFNILSKPFFALITYR